MKMAALNPTKAKIAPLSLLLLFYHGGYGLIS